MHFSGLLFFLLILEAGVSAFAAVRIGSISSKNLRKKLVYVIFILKFTLDNLEALTESPLLKNAKTHKYAYGIQKRAMLPLTNEPLGTDNVGRDLISMNND